MRIAISFCPNDTYLFHAWIQGFVGEQLKAEPHFADIQHLNEWAIQGTYPLIKLSFNCFAEVIDNYELLPVGTAMGFNCGPKIISKSPFPLSDLNKKKIAIPGKGTTAHLLLNRLGLHPKEKFFCLYHEIADHLKRDEAECGLIIHESRFTFRNQGFVEICDLGNLWQKKTGAPLPLGGLAIKRSLPKKKKWKIVKILRNSLNFARENPEKSIPFILAHSQEKDPLVVQKHIETYVNNETESLSQKGIGAIEELLCLKSSSFLLS